MALQKVINTQLAAGVEGGLYDDSPRRAEAKRLHANSGVAAALGRAFTQGDTEDDVTVGGEGAFAVGGVLLRVYAVQSEAVRKRRYKDNNRSGVHVRRAYRIPLGRQRRVYADGQSAGRKDSRAQLRRNELQLGDNTARNGDRLFRRACRARRARS